MQGALRDAKAAVRAAPNDAYALRRLGVVKLVIGNLEVITS